MFVKFVGAFQKILKQFREYWLQSKRSIIYSFFYTFLSFVHKYRFHLSQHIRVILLLLDVHFKNKLFCCNNNFSCYEHSSSSLLLFTGLFLFLLLIFVVNLVRVVSRTNFCNPPYLYWFSLWHVLIFLLLHCCCLS